MDTKEALAEQVEEPITLDSQNILPAVVYRSLDRGHTWQSFADGLPPAATLSAIVEAAEELYVTTDYHGIYRWNEQLASWSAIGEGLPDNIDINCLVVAGKNMVLGTYRQGIYRSVDGGAHWAPAKTPMPTAIRAMILQEDKIIAGTDDGIWESVDDGDNWQHVEGSMQVLGFTELKGKLYAAAHNGALVKSGDDEWTYIYKDDALHDIGNDGEYVYAMTIGQRLLKSKDDGKVWTVAQQGIPKPPNFYTNELVYQKEDIFSAQWIGIYHSRNNGSSWQQLEGLPAATAFSTLAITKYGIIAGIAIR